MGREKVRAPAFIGVHLRAPAFVCQSAMQRGQYVKAAIRILQSPNVTSPCPIDAVSQSLTVLQAPVHSSLDLYVKHGTGWFPKDPQVPRAWACSSEFSMHV